MIQTAIEASPSLGKTWRAIGAPMFLAVEVRRWNFQLCGHVIERVVARRLNDMCATGFPQGRTANNPGKSQRIQAVLNHDRRGSPTPYYHCQRFPLVIEKRVQSS